MEFIQKVVWIGTVLDGATVEDFESYFKNLKTIIPSKKRSSLFLSV